MNASNSSDDVKWVACPDTTCSTRPARPPFGHVGLGVHLHQKGALRWQGWIVSSGRLNMRLVSC